MAMDIMNEMYVETITDNGNTYVALLSFGPTSPESEHCLASYCTMQPISGAQD